EMARLFQDTHLLMPGSVSARYARLHSARHQQDHFYRKDVTLTAAEMLDTSDQLRGQAGSKTFLFLLKQHWPLRIVGNDRNVFLHRLCYTLFKIAAS
ncbi:MAG: hypothetical protein ABFC77_15935, partial [Thermoguttaceae bacterium]